MNYDWMLLMTGPSGGGGGTVAMLVWIGLLFVMMYFLLIRPQRKRQREHEKLISELKKGDKVVTTGGLFGTIFAIDDEKGRIILRINEETKLEFLKTAIAGKVEK
ncbi:MAG: preprotein translocase subunit YajC [Candidatus Zixiibacteriota bacterium]